ncbi:hypothetical protein M3J09_000635 [Ascochyta lentis]
MAPPTVHASPTKLLTKLLPLPLPLLLLLPHTLALVTPKACPNKLTNPSFETGHLTPWLTILTSAWPIHNTTTTHPSSAPPHNGTYTYHAHSTSTISSSLSLSQSNIPLPVGVTVQCWAWIASSRAEGETRVDVFLDGVVCGSRVVSAGKGEEEGWVRVGGEVTVTGGVEGEGSTFVVVASSQGAGKDGWEVWVDDAGVGGC